MNNEIVGMKLKSILLTLSLLIFLGCGTSTPHVASVDAPSKKNINTKDILKLDTKGHTGVIRDIIVTKDGNKLYVNILLNTNEVLI